MARQSKNLSRNPYIIVFGEGESEELLDASTEDEKYKILYFTDSTFTNAHEAIEYLAAL